MIKKKLFGETTKEQLKAAARDRLHRFLLEGGKVRGAILHGTRMVNEMRASHELGILETLALGHAYMGAGLMSASLKGNDRLGLAIKCSGPIKGLQVEASATGEIRGFLSNVPIPIDKPMEDFDLSPFFGAGFLTVTKNIENAKQPYTGQVMLQYGNLAEELAGYYLHSEQTPTALDLSVRFDREGNVTGAGALLLQAMPDAGDELAETLESLVAELPSIGTRFSEGETPEELVKKAFGAYDVKFLASHRIEFFCPCNDEKIRSMLSMLPPEELDDIHANGPFPLETCCHNCNTAYRFEKQDIEEIRSRRK